MCVRVCVCVCMCVFVRKGIVRGGVCVCAGVCVYARMIVCVCVGEYAHTVVWQGRSVCVWKVSAVRECVCVCVCVCFCV